MADRKRKIPKDITRRGPKKPSKPPKVPPKKGPRRPGPGQSVIVKKEKYGNWVPQPVPKPQIGPGTGPLYDPTRPDLKKKGRRRKPTPK